MPKRSACSIWRPTAPSPRQRSAPASTSSGSSARASRTGLPIPARSWPSAVRSYSRHSTLWPPHRGSTAPDNVRRLVNQTSFQRFYVDNEGVTGEELQSPFDELQQARHVFTATQKSPRDAEAPARPETDLLFLHDVLAAGSSKTVMVELRGIEPLTSSMRTKRATNCATAPIGPYRNRSQTLANRAPVHEIAWSRAAMGAEWAS